MKCIVPGPNVKVLGRAIHSLAKLGDELYLEFSATDLSFRTTNASKTVYAIFQFSVNFFSFFSPNSEKDGQNFVKCQLSMKSSLSVFRSPITLDRTVDSLVIQLCDNNDKLIFLIKYKKGFVKTYHVPVIDCESLQAFYKKEKAPNKLIVQPKVVCDIMSNFQNNQSEITWKVTKDQLIVRNFSQNEIGYNGVRTEIKVEKYEFDEFKIEKETEITFCMKELRAVLLFSDNVVLPLTVYFFTSSKPIVFSVKGEVFEADIVVSTLTGSDYVETETGSSEQNLKSSDEINKEKQQPNRNPSNAFLSCMDLDGEQVVLNVNQEDIVGCAENTENNNRTALRHIFYRCFEKDKFDVRKLPGYDVVLASDSDPGSDKE